MTPPGNRYGTGSSWRNGAAAFGAPAGPRGSRGDSPFGTPTADPNPGGRLTIPKDPLRISLFLVVLFSISRIHQHFGVIGQLRPAFLLFAFCALYVVLVPRSIDIRNLSGSWAPKAMAGLAVVACFSILFGISMGSAASFFLQEYARTLIFAFLLIVAVRSVSDLSLLVWAFIVSAGLWVWLAFFVFEPEMDVGSGRGNVRLSGLYTYDANDLGLIMMITLPLTLLVLQAAKGRLAKFVCGGTLIGIGMTTAMTGSRGAMVGLFAVGAALFFTLTHIPLVKRVGLIGVIAFALAIAAPAGYWESMRSLASPTEDYNWSSPDGRKQVALRGLGYMMAYPVFGIGVGNFSRAEGTISSKARTHIPGTGIRWTAAHNSYVQIGAEMGPLGLGLFLSLLYGGTVGIRRVRKRIPGRWERGDDEQRFLFYTCRYLPVAFVGFAMPALFVSFAYLTPFYFLTAFATSFYVLLDRKLKEEGKRGFLSIGSPGPGWRSDRHDPAPEGGGGGGGIVHPGGRIAGRIRPAGSAGRAGSGATPIQGWRTARSEERAIAEAGRIWIAPAPFRTGADPVRKDAGAREGSPHGRPHGDAPADPDGKPHRRPAGKPDGKPRGSTATKPDRKKGR